MSWGDQNVSDPVEEGPTVDWNDHGLNSRTTAVQEERGAYDYAPLGTIRSYRDLLAWQLSMALVESCVGITRNWPRLDQDSLGIQLRRAAISVPSNIAEGYGRQTVPEVANRLRIAHGSLCEVETQLQIAQRLNMGAAAAVSDALQLAERTGQLLQGLMRSIARQRASNHKGD
jgi:four helix bundle protein